MISSACEDIEEEINQEDSSVGKVQSVCDSIQRDIDQEDTSEVILPKIR